MAEVSIIIPPRVSGASLEDADGGALIVFDVSREETHELDVEVTRHPVEDGVEIVDHAQVLPLRVTVDAVVSATPLTLDDDAPDDLERHLDAYQTLLRVARERVPFTLTTGLAVYEDVILRRVPIRRSAASGLSIQGPLEFEQIRRVSRAEALIPPEVIEPAIRSAASPERDSGRTQAQGASGSQARRAASTLARATGRGAVP